MHCCTVMDHMCIDSIQPLNNIHGRSTPFTPFMTCAVMTDKHDHDHAAHAIVPASIAAVWRSYSVFTLSYSCTHQQQGIRSLRCAQDKPTAHSTRIGRHRLTDWALASFIMSSTSSARSLTMLLPSEICACRARIASCRDRVASRACVAISSCVYGSRGRRE